MKFVCQNPLQGAVLKPQALGGNITQYYGENPQLYNKIPRYPQGMGHNGLDIALAWGTPILAAHDGIVRGVADGALAGVYGGQFVMLHSDDFLNDENNKTCKAITGYFHLSKIMVKVGDAVKAGDTIALEGNTGYVVSVPSPYWNGINPYAGSHLHFSIAFAEKIGTDNYRPILNSYGVATVDPTPYLGIENKAQIQIGIMKRLVDAYQKLISIFKR